MSISSLSDAQVKALYGLNGGGGGAQSLSQSGNTVTLSGSPPTSVDISITTAVNATTVKTTAQTYNAGLLATEFSGLLFAGETEIGKPLQPTLLTVNGTLDVINDPAGFVRLTNLGSVLPAGQNVLYIDPILGTVGQGGAPASTWVGTATSDLNMNGYDIYNASNLTLRSDTGLLKIRSEGTGGANGVAIQSTTAPIVLSTNNEINMSADGNISIETSTGLVSISNPTLGNGGVQLNVDGSASIRGDTAQLQVLNGAGVQKGVLSYNSIDGQTHLDGTDLAISAGLGVEITAGNDDLTLLASVGSINVESHTDIGISCNNNGVISVGGADTSQVNISTADMGSVVGIAGESININGGFLNANLGGSISLITSGTVGITADDPITISTTGSTDSITISSASELGLSASTGVNITANDSSVSIASVTSGNVSISAYEALGLSTVNNGISISSADTLTIGATTTCSISGQGTTIGGGDEYLTMGAETVTVTSASNIDMTTGQYFNITATANDINLTANAGSIVANAGGGISTNSGSVSMTSTSGSIELHANGSDLVLASGGDAVTISSGGGDNISLTAGGGGLILTTAGDLVMNGAGIQDTSYGTPSGQYLRIYLNGTFYKIQLLDDV